MATYTKIKDFLGEEDHLRNNPQMTLEESHSIDDKFMGDEVTGLPLTVATLICRRQVSASSARWHS